MLCEHLTSLSKSIDTFAPKYDYVILLGDFNAETTVDKMSEFCEVYNIKNLVKEPTCYKNPMNPSCIDLIMTNHPNSFFNTRVIETGLSDFHKLTVTILKTSYKKQTPTVISYRDYKNYSPSLFRAEFDNFIYFYGIYSISNDEFVNMYIHILNTHAPIKRKYIRANENPFIEIASSYYAKI